MSNTNILSVVPAEDIQCQCDLDRIQTIWLMYVVKRHILDDDKILPQNTNIVYAAQVVKIWKSICGQKDMLLLVTMQDPQN